jgi:hypothetical protein
LLLLQKNVPLHGADLDNAPTVGDEGSTSMSVLARDEELLIEWNDIARQLKNWSSILFSLETLIYDLILTYGIC